MEACLSIVLHEFTAWAGCNDHNYRGQKYHVDKINKGDTNETVRRKKQEERQQRMQEQHEEMFNLETQAGSSAPMTYSQSLRGLFHQSHNDNGDY
jgi:hypothetical protein